MKMKMLIGALALTLSGAAFAAEPPAPKKECCCCKKGEDDPVFSLRTRKARVEGKWTIQTGSLLQKG